jgi:hypothetical protein
MPADAAWLCRPVSTCHQASGGNSGGSGVLPPLGYEQLLCAERGRD